MCGYEYKTWRMHNLRTSETSQEISRYSLVFFNYLICTSNIFGFVNLCMAFVMYRGLTKVTMPCLTLMQMHSRNENLVEDNSNHGVKEQMSAIIWVALI